ncbi:unnamed protein product [Staurois parvus]|uniref:Uncharacterized protein n=1 Tax=Staurois parvus TaxID=386267 RepID=A0ABN9CH24_9NEOB|nr:unnamed protein product [Staurois parvus]
MCHFQVSSHCGGFHLFLGCLADYRAFLRCHLAPSRPWAPRYRLVTLLLGPQCDLGPCTASHCLPLCHCCHFQVSSRPVVSILVIGCCMASPLLAASTAHSCGSKLWFVAR